VFCAISNPTLGRVIYIGDWAFGERPVGVLLQSICADYGRSVRRIVCGEKGIRDETERSCCATAPYLFEEDFKLQVLVQLTEEGGLQSQG